MSVSAGDLAGVSGLALAFGAGLASFLSPCVLPLVPSYLAVLGGTVAPQGDAVIAPNGAGSTAGVATPTRPPVLRAGIAFVLGFSAVFVLFGATASSLGRLVLEHATWIADIGGVLLVLFGLHLLGLLRLSFLEADTRRMSRFAGRGSGAVGACAIGAAFAAGWSPCIGPVLAGVLALAAVDGSALHGMLLLAVYSLGLAVPFLATAVALDRAGATSTRWRRWSPIVTRISGTLLIVLGLLLATGTLARLSGWAARFTPGWIS